MGEKPNDVIYKIALEDGSEAYAAPADLEIREIFEEDD